MDFNPIEIAGTITGLVYLFLLIKRNIWCWPFGILSSLFSIWLLLEAKLYTESALSFYYVIAGFYGWMIWKKDASKTELKELAIKHYSLAIHLRFIMGGLALSLGLGWFMKNNTDGNNPFLDSFITIFSFIATYLEAHRILAGWYYWIILNALSVGLYLVRGLPIYAGLMLIYTIMSVYGLIKWQKIVNNLPKNAIL